MRKFFEPGNTAAIGHGRPLGAKDKVARLVWQEVLEFLTVPASAVLTRQSSGRLLNLRTEKASC